MLQQEDREAPSSGLEHLEYECLAIVAGLLSPADLLSCMATSKSLRVALQDDRVYFAMCKNKWGGHTDVRRWLGPPAPRSEGTPGRTPGRACLQTYRQLHQLLHQAAGLACEGGMWRVVGAGSAGGLIVFSWTQSSIEGHEIQCAGLEKEDLERMLWARICPARGAGPSVELEGRYATLTESSGGGTPQEPAPFHRSPSVEAAAAVALGSSPTSSSPLGSTFSAELERFMSLNVASRSRQRRRPRGGGSQGAASPVVHHLKRVDPPIPTLKHPWAGLWAADCGERGAALLRTFYDFSASAAQVVAVVLAGNAQLPAGSTLWVARAAAVQQPWPAREQLMVEQQQERWLEEDEWLLPPDEVEDAAAGSSIRRREVASLHKGWGYAAAVGAAPAPHQDGRLLLLASGRLVFLWLQSGWAAEMRRIAADELV